MATIQSLEGKPWYFGLAAGALVGLVLVALFWQLRFKPMKQEIASQDRTLQELQAKIQEGRAAKQRLPQFREEVRRLELELDKLLRILPARRNVEDLLRRVRSLAEQGDHELLRFAPGSLADREFYSEWPITITMNGTYHNLALFFDRVSRFSRIINVDQLQMQAMTRPGQSITASFVAKTFVYRDLDEPDTGGGG